MRNLDQIWQEYIDHDEVLPKDALSDLVWHIENDEEPEGAIILATDMGLRQLGPILAKHLDHEDDYVRQVTVGSIIGRLFLAEYAEKALDMATNDPDSGPRSLAVSNIGAILDQVDMPLQKKIANHIYDVVTNDKYNVLHRDCAYSSVVKAMNIPPEEWPPVKLEPDLSKLINPDLVDQFRKKYKL